MTNFLKSGNIAKKLLLAGALAGSAFSGYGVRAVTSHPKSPQQLEREAAKAVKKKEAKEAPKIAIDAVAYQAATRYGVALHAAIPRLKEREVTTSHSSNSYFAVLTTPNFDGSGFDKTTVRYSVDYGNFAYDTNITMITSSTDPNNVRKVTTDYYSPSYKVGKDGKRTASKSGSVTSSYNLEMGTNKHWTVSSGPSYDTHNARTPEDAELLLSAMSVDLTTVGILDKP